MQACTGEDLGSIPGREWQNVKQLGCEKLACEGSLGRGNDVGSRNPDRGDEGQELDSGLVVF